MQGKVEICGVNTAKLPILKEEEKEALFARIKAGDDEAKEEYIKGNLRLVLSVIKRFHSSNENPDDLFQIGCIGLIKAINTFKPEVIALNCCAAETKENGRLIMGAEDVWNVSLAAPEAKLYLTHMDNVAHASVTRFTMRGQLTAYGVSNYDMLGDGGSVVY